MRRWTLLALGVLCALVLCVGSAAAEPLQTQPAPPGPDLGAFLSNPGAWVTDVFNTALLGLGKGATGDVVGFLNWLINSSSNVISQTPPELSYDNGAVRGLWDRLRLVANAGLGAVTVFGAWGLVVQPHVRAPYHGALELVPRLAIGALLVNTSLSWGRFTIDLNNLVCQQIGPGVLPGWAAVSSADAGELLSNLIAIVVYLLVGVLLVTQMLMRLALVDALLIVAPLAMLCWVVPQTYGWARLWFQTFFSTIFVQVLQVVVLQLGSALVGDLARQMPAVLSNPLDGGRAWMSSLMLGVAVLQLARLAPRLVPGYPMGGWPVPRDLGPRQLLATVSGGRFGGDRSGRK